MRGLQVPTVTPLPTATTATTPLPTATVNSFDGSGNLIFHLDIPLLSSPVVVSPIFPPVKAPACSSTQLAPSVQQVSTGNAISRPNYNLLTGLNGGTIAPGLQSPGLKSPGLQLQASGLQASPRRAPNPFVIQPTAVSHQYQPAPPIITSPSLPAAAPAFVSPSCPTNEQVPSFIDILVVNYVNRE